MFQEHEAVASEAVWSSVGLTLGPSIRRLGIERGRNGEDGMISNWAAETVAADKRKACLRAQAVKG